MNKVILSVNICSDIRVNYTNGENRTAIAHFSVAINGYGENDKTTFMECDAFGKQAEFLQKYAHKGSKVLIEARIKNGDYEKDGQTVKKILLAVNSVELLDPKPQTQQAPQQAPQPQMPPMPQQMAPQMMPPQMPQMPPMPQQMAPQQMAPQMAPQMMAPAPAPAPAPMPMANMNSYVPNNDYSAFATDEELPFN